MNSITTLVNVRTESQGCFDDATMALLTTLYPHIRRAALIGRVIGDHQKQAVKSHPSAPLWLCAGHFRFAPVVSTGRRNTLS
jgi:hypothetical protein